MTNRGILIAACLLLGGAPLAGAKEFRHVELGASLDVPSDWDPLPEEMMQQLRKRVEQPGGLKCAAAFGIGSLRSGFDPYVLVMYRKMDTSDPHAMDHFAEGFSKGVKLAEKKFSDLSGSKISQPIVDRERGRALVPFAASSNGVKFKSLMVLQLGKDGVIAVAYYAREANWDDYAKEIQTSAETLSFDRARAYTPPGFFRRHRAGLIGLLVGVIVALFVGVRTRQASRPVALGSLDRPSGRFGSPSGGFGAGDDRFGPPPGSAYR